MRDVVIAAQALARVSHIGQMYGKLPYSYHLEAVVLAVGPGASDILKAAAWLHDAVEDTKTTLHDVRVTCGGRVAQLVDAVTDAPGDNRAERKAGMYRKLDVAPVEARRLKLADRVANTEASIENPKLGAMYAREFSEFIRHAGKDKANEDLVLRLFWLHLDATEAWGPRPSAE